LYGARGLWAHRATVDSLPPDLRLIVNRAVRAAIDLQRSEAAALERKLRTRMETRGIEFVDLDDDARSRFLEASAPAIEVAHQGVPEGLFELARS
ncbi:MAG: hypothetical protein GEU71_17505, partial [Actinobacteria bacterium]|nr:hypothetical protein [Actinomycetota bacterium]